MCLHNDFKDTHFISRDIVAQMIESENIYAKNVRHKSEPIKNANERSEKKSVEVSHIKTLVKSFNFHCLHFDRFSPLFVSWRGSSYHYALVFPHRRKTQPFSTNNKMMKFANFFFLIQTLIGWDWEEF